MPIKALLERGKEAGFGRGSIDQRHEKILELLNSGVAVAELLPNDRRSVAIGRRPIRPSNYGKYTYVLPGEVDELKELGIVFNKKVSGKKIVPEHVGFIELNPAWSDIVREHFSRKK